MDKNFNHISENLNEDEIEELISYYKTYHRKEWAFKKHYKHHRRLRYIANTASLLIASTSIASSLVFLPAVAVSSIAVLIQSWIRYSNYDQKIKTSQYAYQSYSHFNED